MPGLQRHNVPNGGGSTLGQRRIAVATAAIRTRNRHGAEQLPDASDTRGCGKRFVSALSNVLHRKANAIAGNIEFLRIVTKYDSRMVNYRDEFGKVPNLVSSHMTLL